MAQTKNNTKNSGTKSKASASGSKSKEKSRTSSKKETEPKNRKLPVPKKDNAREERDDAGQAEGFVNQLTPYIAALLALLLAICIIAGEGKIGGGIRGLLAGLFSGAAYLLPVCILVRALTWRRDIEEGALATRSAAMIAGYLSLAMLLHIMGGGEAVLSLVVHFQNGQAFVGGGLFGGFFGELLVRGFGKICSVLILLAALFLLVLYIAGMTPRGAFIYIAYKIKVTTEKRRARLAEQKNPSRREERKVREEEYLQYLREKKRRQREMLMQNPPQEMPVSNGIPAETPAPTVYRVKRRRVVQPEDQIPDGTIPMPPAEPAVTETYDAPEETIVAGGQIFGQTEEVFRDPEPKSCPDAPEPIAKPAAKADNGAMDERIFDEVMRRTRERIEKSRRTEGIRETTVPKKSHADTVVTVDTATGEVIEEPEEISVSGGVPYPIVNGKTLPPDELLDEMFSDNPIFGDGPEDDFLEDDEEPVPAPAPAKRERPSASDTTDTVRLAAEVSEVSAEDGDGYDVSNIFVNPEDAELLDKLSEAYRQNSSASLDVKRGVIGDAAAQEAPKAKAAVPDYKFPPVELMTEDTSTGDDDIKEELQENAVKLVETLESFNVKTKIADVSRGPTITRYELLLERGTRVRSVTNLVDDIALNLATKGVRIEAPIPGKSAVGIEVPNKNQSTVHLRTLICDERFVNAKSKLTICLGEDVAGEAVYYDIAKFPHLLIAGTTGSGKSVCINSVIMSLLYKASPEDVKLILIDPKKVELNIYNGIPHLLSPVISDPKKAAGSLSWAVSEMERRFGLIEAVGVRDINAYNKITKDDPDYEYMNRIVIIIDELADFMMTAPDEVEDSICRIAQKARAAGMHLIIGTQRPSVNVVTGLIKANVPSRIAFAVQGQVDSRVILDKAGAETLIGKGDMLFSPIGAMTPTRVQGAFISEEDVEKVVAYIKNMNPAGEAVYSEEVLKQIEEEAAKCGAGKKGAAGTGGLSSSGDDDGEGDDPMLKAAVELAVDTGKISTSLIQRKLSLGYGRAAKLIDAMESLGYVSAPDGQKPRKVLITRQQYMEMVLKDEAPFD